MITLIGLEKMKKTSKNTQTEFYFFWKKKSNSARKSSGFLFDTSRVC